MSEESDTAPLLDPVAATTEDDDVPNILSDQSALAPLAVTDDGDVPNILTDNQPPNDAEIDDDEATNAMAALLSGDASAVAAATATENAAPATSGGRTSTSSSSVSRSNRRNRRHRRRHRRRSYFPGLKGKETNFLAAVCSMVVMVAVCTALVEPQWFSVYGGGCRDGKGDPIGYIGMTEFIRHGEFVEVTRHDKEQYHKTQYIYRYGHGDDQVMYDCVSPKMVNVLHCISALCFLIIALSLFAFLFDLAGPSNRVLRETRRHAVFNVVSVLLCVLVNGFCFWVTELLDQLQDQTKRHTSSRVDVQFSVSFYLMASAGAVSVLAAACNLLRANIPSHHHHHHMDPRELAMGGGEGDGRSGELDLPDGHTGSATPPPPGGVGANQAHGLFGAFGAAAFLPTPPPPPYAP